MRDEARPLLERDSELEGIGDLIGRARAGDGCFAAIEGPAGIGKTSLLDAARSRAAAAGVTVLVARAGELERDFPFGVVHQLLEPAIRAAGERERDRLFAGAAGHARPLFDAEPGPPGDPDYATLHGLYWLVAGIAERAPALVAVDDLQWADGPSLRFLSFLARRLEGLRVVVLAALRDDDRELLAELAGEARIVLRPAALSAGAVTELVGAELGAAQAPFAAACERATAGNPFYLRALMDELAARGLEPTGANAALVSRLSPRAVARAVLLRIAGLPPGAADLARAVAVLGDGAGLSEAAALAGIPGERAAVAVAGLTRAAILHDDEDALGFAHPIARAAVYAEIGPHRRAEMHAAAARLRAGAGESAELVAAQLAHAPPGEVDGAGDILAAAADQALDRGAPDAAATYLRRALREPLDEPRRAAFSARLGHAAARAGLPEAADELRHAIDLALNPRRRAAIALELGHLLAARGESAAAVELLGGHARDLAADAPGAAARLEAELLAIGDADLGARALALAQAPGLLQDYGSDPASIDAAQVRAPSRRDDGPHADPIEAMLLVHRATEATMAARGAGEAAELARRALEHGTLLAAGMSGAQLAFLAAYFLLCADRFAEAERFYDGALDAARRAGSGVGFASASAGRAYVALQRGRLGDAETDARAALDMARATGVRLIELLSASLLGLALAERGAARQAADEIERLELGERDADIVQGTGAVVTRGQARIVLGDVEGGVADLLAAGKRLTAIGLVNPASFPWRSAASGGLAALGRREEAAALAAEEVALARRWGAPRALAVALRAEGALTRSTELLREAVAVLDGSEATLERARALTELGAALRRSGRRSEAREPLRMAIELAGECGAAPLADRARTELRAAGGRPRAPLRTGIDALTASERRIAEMAAAGRSNPEIAQDLFVTVKTVEMHLSGAYRKLGIRSRSQLPGVLTAERS